MTYGDIGDPYQLAHAFGQIVTRIRPGNTVYLRGGTYTGNFTCNISGTSGNPVTFRAYPGETPIIDGQLTINGDYITWQGMTHTNSTSRDRSASVGTVGIDCQGDGISIINCIVRDHDQGLTTTQGATGHSYYGNLFQYNGWATNQGHGMYPQNAVGNTKTIARNIIIDNFAYGIHCWATSGDISDFTISENISAVNGEIIGAGTYNILVARQAAHSGNTINGNITYSRYGVVNRGIGCGTLPNPSTGWSVYDNRLVNSGRALVFYNATITRCDGNTIHGWIEGWNTTDWPDNDVTSGQPAQTTYPTSGNEAYLFGNAHDSSRAQLAIYNWDLANTVAVDVSGVYSNGTNILARNAQDYDGDIQHLTVSAGSVTIDMQAVNRSVRSPVGYAAPATTFPQFGAFVLTTDTIINVSESITASEAVTVGVA